MNFTNEFYTIRIDEKGQILSLSNSKKEMIGTPLPLAALSLRNKAGEETVLDTAMAEETSVSLEGNLFNATFCFAQGITLKATALFEEEISWSCMVENSTEDAVEWVRCPQFATPLDLMGNGGSSKILWGFNEGCVVEDLDYRQKGFGYKEPKYPGEGTMPVFPAIVETPCMAYYDGENGLYIGAHDKEGNVKSFDFVQKGEAIFFDIRFFTGCDFGADYEQSFPLVMKMFRGEWMQAANIYRNWFDANKHESFKKINENPRIPDWYKESPIIITYPVRGHHDMDVMDPNGMFPYINAMEHIERFAEALDSKVMALLMHWEGSAPWAPPFVWPPFGGEECLKEFIDALHEKGHIFGVYCSGIGWTEQSHLVKEYNREKDFIAMDMEKEMCVSPAGVVEKSHICDCIRAGYDFCPTSEALATILEKEVSSMVGAGIDYVQVLDQNHGGTSYFCYGREHGHPPVPGKWQTEAMRTLLGKLNNITKENRVLLGCESAAAETYIPDLLFSDNRYNLCYDIGRPVPLYSYIYHEYVNNFSGNQVVTGLFLNHNKSPENLRMRIAHSFIAGDMLTLVINDKGEIAWNWGAQETDAKPSMEETIAFVKNLNYWRRTFPQYLNTGRMTDGYTVTTTAHKLYHQKDYADLHDDIYTSAWTEGKKIGQFLVNYNSTEKECTLNFGKETSYKILTAEGTTEGKGEKITLTVPPLSAILIEA